MTRRDTIIELARTLRDVDGTSRVEAGHGETHGKPDARVLQHTSLYKAGSYAALEHALEVMRLSGDPIRQQRWHFTTRYLNSTRKAFPARTRGSHVQILVNQCWESANPIRGHREALGGLYVDSGGRRVVMVEQWHNHVQLSQVDKALDWLEQHMPRRLWLPNWAEAA